MELNSALTKTETSRLRELELVIDLGKQTFLEVGLCAVGDPRGAAVPRCDQAAVLLVGRDRASASATSSR